MRILATLEKMRYDKSIVCEEWADVQNKATITICGREFKIVSDDSGEYIHQLAYELNERIRKTSAAYIGLPTSPATALTALQILDELTKKTHLLEQTAAELREMKEKLKQTEIELRILEEKAEIGQNAKLKRALERIKSMEAEKNSSRNEP